MKVRQFRVNSQGKCNFDFKASSDIAEYKKDGRLSYLASSVKNSISDITKSKQQRIAPNPLTQTQEFYQSHNKNKKPEHQVSNPRRANLEDKQKRQKAFNGDSDHLTYEHSKIKWTMKDQELTLPNLKIQTDDKDKIVSIDKVKQLINIIRQRYSIQKDAYKIFKTWDKQNKGFIDNNQFQNLLHDIGIQCNNHEVDLIMSTVDQNQNGTISIDEFQTMIYQEDKFFNNVNNKLTVQEKEQLKQSMYEKTRNYENHRQLSTYKLFVKRKLRKILNYCNNENFQLKDLNKEQLQKCFQSLEINKGNEKQFDKFFDEFKKDNGKIDLAQVHDELDYFCFDVDHNLEKDLIAQAKFSKEEMTHNLKIYNEFGSKQIKYQDYSRKNDSKANKQFKSKQKILRILKKSYKNQDDFISELKKLYGDDFESQNIKKDQFESDIKKIINDKQIDDKIFNEFVNTFQFQNDQTIDLKNVPSQIYNENINQYYDRIFRDTKINKDKVQLDFDFDKLSKIQEIFQKVDDKVFFGTQKIFEVFSKFDQDKDGYVSKQELQNYLKDKFVLDKDESQIFVNNIFKDDNQYLNFKQFSNIIRPNMGQSLIDKDQYQNVAPCNDNNNNLLRKTKNLVNLENEMISNYQSKQELIPFQRYSFTPEYQNTFGNFYGQKQSSLYNNTERQFQKHYEKNDFQKEDKLRKTQIQENVYKKKQQNIENLKKEEIDQFRDTRDQANLRTKSLATWTYQQQFKRINEKYQQHL